MLLGVNPRSRGGDGVFSLFALRGERYEPIAASDVLPEVDLARLAYFASMGDQHAALRPTGTGSGARATNQSARAVGVLASCGALGSLSTCSGESPREIAFRISA